MIINSLEEFFKEFGPPIGPVHYIWGTSPYLDWFLETHYVNARAWKQ